MNPLPDKKVNLQIPIDPVLRAEVEVYASELGFNSVQDFTRVLYKTILADKLVLHIVPRGYRASKMNFTEDDYEEYRRNRMTKSLRQHL